MRIGPIDPRLPGVFSLDLDFEGDWIRSSKAQFGFTVKGIEQTILNKPRKIAAFYSGKIDPEAAFYYEWALSLAVERIAGFEPSLRAKIARLVFSELTRVAAHLKTIALLSKEAGVFPAFHYLMREREKVLDLFELATGSRHSLNICAPGGLADEISEGFIERVKEVVVDIESRLKETHVLLSENVSFKKRTKNKGVLSKETISNMQMGGLIARSAGLRADLREQEEFYLKNSWSQTLCPDAISGAQSDVYSRFFVWMAETEESILLLGRLCSQIPHSESVVGRMNEVPAGSAQVSIETQRGALNLSLTVPEEDQFGYETHWLTPSQKIAECIPEAIKGARSEDVFLILQSLNFSVSEVDR